MLSSEWIEEFYAAIDYRDLAAISNFFTEKSTMQFGNVAIAGIWEINSFFEHFYTRQHAQHLTLEYNDCGEGALHIINGFVTTYGTSYSGVKRSLEFVHLIKMHHLEIQKIQNLQIIIGPIDIKKRL